jgi:hypothetical protein
MSASQAAHAVEQLLGHDKNAVTEQDVANYEGAPDNLVTMKALTWQGKNKVAIGKPQGRPPASINRIPQTEGITYSL